MKIDFYISKKNKKTGGGKYTPYIVIYSNSEIIIENIMSFGAKCVLYRDKIYIYNVKSILNIKPIIPVSNKMKKFYDFVENRIDLFNKKSRYSNKDEILYNLFKNSLLYEN